MFQKIGFASCERKVGATEGINVLIEREKLDGQWAYGVTCIEYTELEDFFIADTPISPTRYFLWWLYATWILISNIEV